jgi:nicotinamide mononucleotide adenylyltransferase
MKYSLFIGRWQPWHDGHRWLIDQQLNKGKNVWLAIRDVPTDKNNPFTPKQVLDNLTKELIDLIQEGRIMISIIPDIDSVNYGRGVGYGIIEHVPPTEINEISATKIREQLRNEGKL